MTHLKHEKKITYMVIFTFVAQPLFSVLGGILFPYDLTAEYPNYPPGSIMMMVCGGALGMAGFTVMGVKLADERKVLPAAGFTMLAISSGILLASIFEISQVVSYETYVKFYRIQASGIIILLPGMYLISHHEDFKKWIRYIGLISSGFLSTSSFMFLFGNRDFRTLETIANIGFFTMFISLIAWAYNLYINYKKLHEQS